MKSWKFRRTVTIVLMLSLTTATAGRAADSVEQQFEQFCAQWMEKLAARERDNLKQIRWVTKDNGVEGEYVGYSADHTCELKTNADAKAVPVGKISYREFLYRKRGDSPAAAGDTTPQAVEATEVTEIFRYAKGKWTY